MVLLEVLAIQEHIVVTEAVDLAARVDMEASAAVDLVAAQREV